MINIEKDWKCVPYEADPDYDNAPALNELFDKIGTIGERIYVPGRAYRINDTVRIPPRTAVSVEGTGGSMLNAQSQYTKGMGPASRLVWFGPEGRPAVSYAGYGLYWQGVSIYGQFIKWLLDETREKRPPKCDIGLLIEGQQSGIGVGKIAVPQISVWGCKTGIQWGMRADINNCDESWLGHVTCGFCDVGMKSITNQHVAVAVSFYHPHMSKTALRFDRGGKFTCAVMEAIGPQTVLSLGKVDSNCATYRLDNVIVDNRAASNFKLLDMDSPGPAHVCIGGDLPSYKWSGDPIVMLRGNARLTLRDVYRMRENSISCMADATTWGGEKVTLYPNVRLDSCRMDHNHSIDKVILPGSGYAYSYTGCYRHTGHPIADASYFQELV